MRRHYRGGEDLGSYGHIINCPDAVLSSLFEEHGIVDNCPSRIKIGDKLTIIPNYIMDNINIHDTLYGIRKDTVEVIWPISAREKSLTFNSRTISPPGSSIDDIFANLLKR